MRGPAFSAYQAPAADLDPPRQVRGHAVRWSARVLVLLLGLHMIIRVIAIAVDISADLFLIGLEGDFDLEQARAEAAQILERVGGAAKLGRASWALLVPAWLTWAVFCNRLSPATAGSLFTMACGGPLDGGLCLSPTSSSRSG